MTNTPPTYCIEEQESGLKRLEEPDRNLAHEDKDTPERPLDGCRNVLSWVLTLADSDTDELSADVSKLREAESASAS